MPKFAENGSRFKRNHAIVHTASIDIKIMRLDKKQITLSVFRQLEQKQLLRIDWPGKDFFGYRLNGVPWGRVLYTWGDCPNWVDYWVVWQDGDSLYRSPMVLRKNATKSVKLAGTKSDEAPRLYLLMEDIDTEAASYFDADGVVDALFRHVDCFNELEHLFIAV